MAETSVKQQICQKCGAEVRPNAMFCYHCGGAVAADDAPTNGDVSNAWFRDDLTEEKTDSRQTSKLSSARVKKAEQSEPIKKPLKTADRTPNDADAIADDDDFKTQLESRPAERTNETEAEQTAAQPDAAAEEPKLKSAAAMRRKPKTIQRKQTEIVWEKPAGISLGGLIAVTIVCLVFAAIVVWMALYLR